MQERETKLEVPPVFQVPEFDGQGAFEGVSAIPMPDRRFRTVYLDTPDLRLARWGASLRHRSEEGWTAKLPGHAKNGLLVRDEHNFPGEAGSVPPEATDLLRAYLRSSEPRPSARLAVVRRGVSLVDGEGRVLALVTDDEVSVLDGRRIAARFREVEVEQTGDTPKGFDDALIERLRSAGAGPPDPTPKYIRAVGPAATAPADVVIPGVSRDPSASELIRRAVATDVIRLFRHDAVIREGVDPEGVHQSRVATRRLRSVMRTFDAMFDADWAGTLRTELSWLGAALGHARDADVLRERLGARAADLPEGDSSETAAILSALDASVRKTHDELLEVLRAERYVRLLDLLVDAANDPKLVPAASESASSMLGAVRAAWEGLENRVAKASKPPLDVDLHKVRIHAKRVRYATEAVEPFVGKPARAFLAELERTQAVLGDHNDGVVARAWLNDWSSGKEKSRGKFVAGELAGLEIAAAAGYRADWKRQWKRLRAKPLRSWM